VAESRNEADEVVEQFRRLGIEIDLVDPSLYAPAPGTTLHPSDAEILAMAAPAGAAPGSRTSTHQTR